MASIVLDSVTVRREGRSLLDAVSFGVAQAECLAVIGPSGSGKTTLLPAVAGLDGTEQGETAPPPAEQKDDEKRRADGFDVLRTLIAQPDLDEDGIEAAMVEQLGERRGGKQMFLGQALSDAFA